MLASTALAVNDEARRARPTAQRTGAGSNKATGIFETLMAQYSKRGRNNNRRRQGGSNNPNRSLDSQGPEVKIRGTAAQIYDKYQALARDAFSAGDRIRGESLMQHAEHYYRLMKSMQPDKPEKKADDADNTSEDQSEDSRVEAVSTTEKADTDAAVVSDNDTESEEKPSADTRAEDTEASEEARPRRRRRRRRSDDQDDNQDTSSEASTTPSESEPQLEEAAAK